MNGVKTELRLSLQLGEKAHSIQLYRSTEHILFDGTWEELSLALREITSGSFCQERVLDQSSDSAPTYTLLFHWHETIHLGPETRTRFDTEVVDQFSSSRRTQVVIDLARQLEQKIRRSVQAPST